MEKDIDWYTQLQGKQRQKNEKRESDVRVKVENGLKSVQHVWCQSEVYIPRNVDMFYCRDIVRTEVECGDVIWRTQWYIESAAVLYWEQLQNDRAVK